MVQKKVHKTPAGFLKSVRGHVDICKPGLVLLLYFTGFNSLLIAYINPAIVFFSIFIGIYFDLSPVCLMVAIIAGTAVVIFSILLIIKKSKKIVWILFKNFKSISWSSLTDAYN